MIEIRTGKDDHVRKRPYKRIRCIQVTVPRDALHGCRPWVRCLKRRIEQRLQTTFSQLDWVAAAGGVGDRAGHQIGDGGFGHTHFGQFARDAEAVVEALHETAKPVEAAGDADMILLGHRANAEYLFYSGYHAKALRQMELALQLAKKNHDFQQEAALGQRLRVMANTAAVLP